MLTVDGLLWSTLAGTTSDKSFFDFMFIVKLLNSWFLTKLGEVSDKFWELI